MAVLRSNWRRLEPTPNPCSEELDDKIQLGELQRTTPNSDGKEKEATRNCHDTIFACKPQYFKYFMLP